MGAGSLHCIILHIWKILFAAISHNCIWFMTCRNLEIIFFGKQRIFLFISWEINKRYCSKFPQISLPPFFRGQSWTSFWYFPPIKFLVQFFAFSWEEKRKEKKKWKRKQSWTLIFIKGKVDNDSFLGSCPFWPLTITLMASWLELQNPFLRTSGNYRIEFPSFSEFWF